MISGLYTIILVSCSLAYHVTEEQPICSLIIQSQHGFYRKIEDCQTTASLTDPLTARAYYNDRVPVGYSTLVVDDRVFDISFKTKTVTIIDLSEPNTLRHQITTVSLTFFPTALGQYSGDMVYVSGEGECDSSGHQTIFSQSIGSVHCTKEGDLWCLSSFTKVIVTKRNCSLPLSSVAFVSSEFPCILVDDRPSTNDIWCYRADISQQSGKRLIGSFDKNRADFITFPKSNDEFYMQYKYKTIKSNPKYQTFSVITETGNTTKMSSPNCPMIGPGVFTCPQFVVLGHEMAEIALTPPQVLLVGDDRIIAYATDKGVKVYSPTFPSGVLLLNSTNVCTDLKISNSIHILDKGNRIIVAMCDKVKSSGYFQIYILYKGNYELSERSGDDCISLNMGQVINAFSPGNIEISVRHLLHPTKETVTVNDSPSSNLSLLGVLVILVLLVIILIPSLIYLVKKVRQRKSKKYQNFTTVRTTEDECETDVESHRDDDNDDIDDFPKPKGSSPTINNHVYDNEDPVISVFPNRHVVTVHFEQPTSLQNKDPGSPKPIDNSNSVCTGSGNVNPAHLICVSDPAAAVNNQVIPIPEDSLMNDQTSTFSQLLDDSPRNQILSSNVHLSFGPLSNPLHPSSSQFLSNQGRPRSQSAPNQDYLSHQSAPNQSLIRSQSLLHDEQHPPPQSTANRDHPPPQSTANRDRPPPQSTANRDHPPPQSTTNRDHPPPQSTANRDHPSTQSTTNRDHPSTQSTASQDWPLSQSATGKGLEIKYEEFVPLKPIKWIKQKTQEESVVHDMEKVSQVDILESTQDCVKAVGKANWVIQKPPVIKGTSELPSSPPLDANKTAEVVNEQTPNDEVSIESNPAAAYMGGLVSSRNLKVIYGRNDYVQNTYGT